MDARAFCVVLTIAMAMLGAHHGSALAEEPETVEEYYRRVLTHMTDLPQPSLVSYDVVVRASGAAFYVSRDPHTGEAEFGFSVGTALGDTSAWWPVLVRTRDNTTSVRLDEARAVTRFPALNATWNGLDAWMRFGMKEATPLPSAGVASPANGSTGVWPEIAVVRALDLGIYRVSDGGMTTCADDSPARLLHLTARDDASRHPATDISVQTSTQTICTIRFGLERSDLVDRNGRVELHLARVGSYYLVDRGEISFDAGPRLGRQHVRLFLDYARIEFPVKPPPGAFATPAPKGRR